MMNLVKRSISPVLRAEHAHIREIIRLRHEMFRAMVAAGAGSRPTDVEDQSWYDAAELAINEQMHRGTLAAYIVAASVVPMGIREQEGSSPHLIACGVATLEDKLPGPGFPRGLGGSISSVYVEEDYRGLGLGRLVTAAGLQWLKQQGVETIDLHATPQAEGIYRSLGFTDSRSIPLRWLNRP